MATYATVISSQNPSVATLPVTFTATVFGQNGVAPTGSVTFVQNSVQVQTDVLALGTGKSTALYTPTYTAAGNAYIYAVYNPDPGFAVSISGTLTQAVAPPVGTMTTVISSQNPSVANLPVTFTGAVSAVNGATPTGSVTFVQTRVAVQTDVLAPGTGQSTALYTPTYTAAGYANIYAVYNPDPGFALSYSGTLTQAVSSPVTTTALASDGNPSVYGNAVNLTAQINVQFGAPPGNVTFYDHFANSGFTVLGTAPVSADAGGGRAVLPVPVPGLSVGTHSLTARYNGGGGFDASVGAYGQTVESPLTTSAILFCQSQPGVGRQPHRAGRRSLQRTLHARKRDFLRHGLGAI